MICKNCFLYVAIKNTGTQSKSIIVFVLWHHSVVFLPYNTTECMLSVFSLMVEIYGSDFFFLFYFRGREGVVPIHRESARGRPEGAQVHHVRQGGQR